MASSFEKFVSFCSPSSLIVVPDLALAFVGWNACLALAQLIMYVSSQSFFCIYVNNRVGRSSFVGNVFDYNFCVRSIRIDLNPVLI